MENKRYKIKPCPYCGATEEDLPGVEYGHRKTTDSSHVKYFVKCLSCSAEVVQDRLDKAVGMWNNRETEKKIEPSAESKSGGLEGVPAVNFTGDQMERMYKALRGEGGPSTTSNEERKMGEDSSIGGLPGDMDNSWPTLHVLMKLTEAAEILLHRIDYDGHGWEQIEHCIQRSKNIQKRVVRDGGALIYALAHSMPQPYENFDPMAVFGVPPHMIGEGKCKGLQCDDMDLRDCYLTTDFAPNGDYYIKMAEYDGNKQIAESYVRISMSGGNAPSKIKLAIANLHRLMEEYGFNGK